MRLNRRFGNMGSLMNTPFDRHGSVYPFIREDTAISCSTHGRRMALVALLERTLEDSYKVYFNLK